MRVLKRALAIVYLAATIVALGTLVCQFWGPYTYRFMLLMRDPMPRIVVTACGGVVAIGVLVSFFRLMFARREPSCVHPAGERNIEVTLAALSSCARTAAERDDRVMVERVEARVQGSDESRVCFKVDAIALDDRDVASLATAMQQRIEEACDTMLGTPGTTTRVRFLPSKTTVQTVEVSGDTNQDKTARTPRLTIDQSATPASEPVDSKAEATELQDAAAADFDEAMGLIKGTGAAIWSYAVRHPNTTLGAVAGFILAVLVLTLGLWDTLVIAFFVLIGAVIGQIRDGENGIVNFFGRLFSGR